MLVLNILRAKTTHSSTEHVCFSGIIERANCLIECTLNALTVYLSIKALQENPEG